MPRYSDFKNQSVSSPTLTGSAVMAAARTGTTVDLAGKYGAMILWTFGSSPAGTGVVSPYIHESDDDVTWGTVAAADLVTTKHGALVGTTSATSAGISYLMGYSGSKRYIRGYLNAGGVLAGGTAVGGTANMPVSATVISFVTGAVPDTDT